MDLWDVPIWSDWFYLIKMLLPRLFVVLMVAFISIRFQWVRRSIQLVDSNWRYRFTLICVFGLFAVSGTLGGVPIDPHHLDVTGCLSTTTLTTLNKNQAIVGFRDTFALLAGLVGGWWVGLGTGLLA
ncbi:MAG: LytS/YhcK type 5TM receptor domain-containing protein, partial [Methylococcales bacterium]